MAIIPEHESKLKTILVSYWHHILGGIILVGSIVILATLGYLIHSTNQETTRTEGILQELSSGPDAEFISNYEKLRGSVTRLKNLTRGSISPTKILKFIQDQTILGTTWTRFSIDASLLRISLHGTTTAGAVAISHIGAQTEAFEKETKAITNVTLSREPIRANTAQAGFSLDMTLEEKYFLIIP